MSAAVLETDRLRLRRMALDDAAFILELVNDPTWLRYIGDRGVRTLGDACSYIAKGPLAHYEHYGFGLYVAELRQSGEPIGICGLLKRDTLRHADLGFALLPRHCGQGFAHESSLAVVQYAHDVLGLNRLLAVTNRDNRNSIKVLERVSFRLEGTARLTEDGEDLALYGREASQSN